MGSVLKHLKTHIFRGFLAVIPVGLSYLVIRFFYLTVDTRVTGIIEKFLGLRIPGLGILLVLIFLYLLGLVASNWLGRKAFSLIDLVTARIPLIKTIYTLGKQLAEALSIPEKQAFKRAVMIEHFRPGLWSVGFVTGRLMRVRISSGSIAVLRTPLKNSGKLNVRSPRTLASVTLAPSAHSGVMVSLAGLAVMRLPATVPRLRI